MSLTNFCFFEHAFDSNINKKLRTLIEYLTLIQLFLLINDRQNQFFLCVCVFSAHLRPFTYLKNKDTKKKNNLSVTKNVFFSVHVKCVHQMPLILYGVIVNAC